MSTRALFVLRADPRYQIAKAEQAAEMKHCDHHDYSTFELRTFAPGTLEAEGLFDPADYDQPDTGPAPLPGQTTLDTVAA